jgi:hypothetical protein
MSSPYQIALSGEEQAVLAARARSARGPYRDRLRAAIVLAAAVMEREDGDQLVIELPGGGSLGYAVFGDPDGVPCFAFHGNSSSRLMPVWMSRPSLPP